jgi:hypothetical protein
MYQRRLRQADNRDEGRDRFEKLDKLSAKKRNHDVQCGTMKT